MAVFLVFLVFLRSGMLDDVEAKPPGSGFTGKEEIDDGPGAMDDAIAANHCQAKHARQCAQLF